MILYFYTMYFYFLYIHKPIILFTKKNVATLGVSYL